jgi:hypothetical protein
MEDKRKEIMEVVTSLSKVQQEIDLIYFKLNQLRIKLNSENSNKNKA